MINHSARKMLVSMMTLAMLSIDNGLIAAVPLAEEPSIAYQVTPDICCMAERDLSACPMCYLNLDFLYWRAFQGGLNQCGLQEIDEFETEDGGIVFDSESEGKDLNFKWNGGYRLGVGQKFSSCWDLAAYWTYFQANASGDQKEEQQEQDETVAFNHPPVVFENADWRLKYQAIDLVLARNFFLPSYCLNLKPFLGLRYAMIHQKLRVNSLGRINSAEQTSYFSIAKKMDEDLYGIGPFLGLQADWAIGCNFSLLGSIDFGALYGRFNVKSHISNALISDINVCDKREKIQACEAFAEAVLGVRWDYCFSNGVLLSLQLCGETHRYFDHSKIGADGDLCFDGGTFSFGFTF